MSSDIPATTLTKIELLSYLPEEWKQFIGYQEFEKSYWNTIINKLNEGKFYPKLRYIFNVFNLIKPNDVKVVIISQDPYINKHQAIGMAFAVHNGLQIPPSLKNIYKEINIEYDLKKDIKKYNKQGDLTPLVNEGVLLLNNILTVKPGKSLSHKNIGWELFTSSVIQKLDSSIKCVFVGYGNYARDILIKFVKFNSKLIYGHPSPLNTTNPFIGCNCFKQINEVLKNNNIKEINWSVIFDDNDI